MSIQQHIISGFVGAPPEIRDVTSKDDRAARVGTINVAVNNPRNRDAEPTWYRVTVWNGLADVVERYVSTGSFVVVSGAKLAASAWTDKQGNARATLELTASSVDFSSNRRNGESADDEAPENPEDIPF